MANRSRVLPCGCFRIPKRGGLWGLGKHKKKSTATITSLLALHSLQHSRRIGCARFRGGLVLSTTILSQCRRGRGVERQLGSTRSVEGGSGREENVGQALGCAWRSTPPAGQLRQNPIHYQTLNAVSRSRHVRFGSTNLRGVRGVACCQIMRPFAFCGAPAAYSLRP